MPTLPLSLSLVTKLKAATAWKFNAQLGPIANPRFFCCDSPNSMGLSEGKEPVAVINLSPNPALEGETISYDGTDSYDPDGSITGYAWSFEDHTPASGTASAGTLNYTTAGTYTVQLVVTDGTGLKSLPAREEAVIVAPAPAAYIATSNGVYYSAGTAPVTWQDKNSGVTGDDLITYAVAIDPATQQLPEASKVVWRAGAGNIMVSVNGGGTWAEKLPGTVTNDWSDSPEPTPGSLTYRDLLFANDRLFAAATWLNGSAEWRSWLFYTDNAPDVRSGGTAAAVAWNQVGVDYLLPIANGNYTGFTAVGAATDWQCVDDPVGSPDELTTYVGLNSATPTRESFVLDAYSNSDTVSSVTVFVRAGKFGSTDPSQITIFLRIGGTDYNGSAQTLAANLGNYTETWTTNPATSSAWTVADLASLEAGALIANSSVFVGVITQLYAVVRYN